MLIEHLEDRRLLSVVNVNLSATNQTIRAMGANFAKIARNPGAPISDANTAWLLENLKPTHARVPINLLLWSPKPDNDDPNSINWAGFVDKGRQTEQFKQLQDLKNRGMWFTASIFDAPDWMVDNPDAIKSRNIPLEKMPFVIEAIGAWLIRARDVYGVKIDNVSFNESNAGYNVRFPISVTKNFINLAGPKFAQMGLGYVKWLIGDDGFVGTGSYVKPALTESTIRPYMGEIGWHSWNLDDFADSYFDDLRRTAKNYGKEIWSTEQGYDPLLYLQNPSQFYNWEHARKMAGIYLRSLKVVQATVLDYWQYGDDFPLLSPLKKPLPTYYVLKPLYDQLTPGTQMVHAGSDEAQILSMAAKNQKDNRFFLQAINNDLENDEIVTFNGLPNQPLTWRRSSATEEGVIVGTYTPVKGTLTLTIPKDSVNSFTSDLFPPGNKPPTPSITGGTTAQYAAGASFNFAGAATDAEDGTLSAGAFRWEISLYHNGKFEDPQVFSGTKTGSFTASTDFSRETDQFYRVSLTVTDSVGQQTTVTKDIYPKLGSITLQTNVPGLFARLDGLAENAPATVPVVAGVHRLEAPLMQSADGKVYKFSSWSNGGAKAHNVTTSGDLTYTAVYKDITGTAAAASFFGASDDAYLADGTLGDSNFGNDAGLIVKTSADVGKSRIAYLKFAISDFDASLGTAELRLYGSYNGVDLVDTAIYPVADNLWSESTITWNNRPAYNASLQLAATKLGDNLNRWYSWDLTSYVAAQKAAGATAVSFAVAQPISGSTETFSSSEAATFRPQLILAPGTSEPEENLTLNASADAYVRDGAYASTNFGSTQELIAKASSSAGNNRIGYFQFDLSGVDTIASAKLKLFGKLSGTGETSVKTNLLDVASQSWVETGIVWSNKPATGASVGSITVKGLSASWYEIDVTNYLRSKKLAGVSKITLAMVNPTRTTPQSVFFSRESGFGPQLTITQGDEPAPEPLKTLSPAADGYVRDGSYASQSFGAAPDLFIKSAKTAGNTRHGYLRFNLADVSSISNARLRVFARLTGTENASIKANLFDVSSQSWTEGALTWNSKPSAGTTAVGSVTVSGLAQSWYEIDLTSYLKQKKSQGATAVSLQLRAATTSTAQILIGARESGNGPQLIVQS